MTAVALAERGATVVVSDIDAAGGEETLAQVLGVPAGRMATPEEIGDCVAWLCLDASPYLTGATITVDGGLTVRG